MPYKEYNFPAGTCTVTGHHSAIIGTAPDDIVSEQINKLRLGEYQGVPNPRFHSLRRAGRLIPYGYYMRWDYTETRDQGTYSGLYKRPLTTPTLSYQYSSNLVRAIPSELSCPSKMMWTNRVNELLANVNTDALLQEAMAKCLPDFDVLTTTSEFGKTLSMLLNARKSAKRLIKQMRRFNWDSVKAASSARLEYYYGWKQLQRDIEGCVGAFNKPFRSPITKGVAKDAYSGNDTTTAVIDGYHVTVDRVVERNEILEVRAIAAAEWEVNTSNVLASPFVTGWELLPYSFIIDWFVNVGDAIKAWHVQASSLSYTSAITISYVNVCQLSIANPRLGIGAYAAEPVSASNSSTSVLAVKQRIPTSIANHLPSLNVQLDSDRLINMAALLAQRF